MIASEENNIPREVKLDGEEQDADFNTKDATVDIVTEEKVVEAARLSCFADHVQQVSVLAMDVTNDTDRLLNFDQISFCLEELQS